MPYTLAKFFLWAIALVLAGGIIGWALRSLKSRGEVAQARSTTVDPAGLTRLRGRVANLEPLVAERDRLRMELADVRGSSAGALGFASSAAKAESIVPDDAADTETSDADDQIAGLASISGEDPGAPVAETVPERETEQAEDAFASDETGDADGDADRAPEPVLDVAAATSILGSKIKLDDLTVIEGIGPKIAELCKGINVTTWRSMSTTELPVLQSMLDDAGSRFKMHKPGSWPRQAGLLADGKWEDFKALTDELDGGR